MTRPKHVPPKKNGRPFVYKITEKPCASCGRIFTMAGLGLRGPSQFRYYRYCSPECRPKPERAVRWTSLEAILQHTELDPVTGCLNWAGRISWKGYGTTSFRGRKARAHRVAYELAKGPIPNGLMILHGCDNRRCINPEHLRAGTGKENMADCIKRGRLGRRRNTVTPEGGRSSLTSAPDAR